MPNGMAAAATKVTGPINFQSTSCRAPINNIMPTGISMMVMRGTICVGPSRIAKIGAISITEPNPANPRIRPAKKAVKPV